MSFLFGKKDKKQNAPAQRPLDLPSGQTSGGSVPTVNGARLKDRREGVTSPQPGASVNNSVNSIDDATTPSPEHAQGQRGRVDSDLQVGVYRARIVLPHLLERGLQAF